MLSKQTFSVTVYIICMSPCKVKTFFQMCKFFSFQIKNLVKCSQLINILEVKM